MPKRSWVWNHYINITDSDVECSICKKRLKSNKCTTNMIKHLKVHNICNDSQNDTINSEHVYPSYTEDNNRKQKIDELILNLIVTDFQPFSIVEDQGFKQLIKYLDPKYVLPSAKTLKKLLNAKYEKQKEKVKKELQEVDNVCVTTDTWTSINTDNYFTITCHFINSYFQMKSYTIETVKIAEKRTAGAISTYLDTAFIEWNITNKIVAVVTDNAANMIAGVRQLQNPTLHIPCFAHTLNLVVKKSLNAIEDICVLREKCRRMVTYFRQSSVAKDKLTEAQSILGLPHHKLKMEVETRWNSTYEMLNRLVEQQQVIVLAMSSLKINFDKLSDVEWETIAYILPILKPFLFATEEISAEKRVTISKVILIKRQLCTLIHCISEENSIQGQLRVELISQLNKYFGDIETNETYGIAALLDPRFRELSFPNDANFAAVQNNLIRIANVADPHSFSLSPTFEINSYSNSETPTTEEGESNFWTTFDNSVAIKNSIASQSLENSVHSELDNYLKEPLLGRKQDPLTYWKENTKKYKKMSVFVRKYFCMMATSVPAERVFSKAGELINKKRNRLKDTTVDKILFLSSLL